MKFAVSLDDNQMYPLESVDYHPQLFWVLEVNPIITLKPQQLIGNNDIPDLLLRTGQARKVNP